MVGEAVSSEGMLEERPMGWAVSTRCLAEYCSYCLEPAISTRLLKCTACKQHSYCGRSCQKADWPMHKMECAICKTCGSAGEDSYRLVLRLWKKLELGEDGTNAGSRRFGDLMDHKKELNNTYETWKNDFNHWNGQTCVINDSKLRSIACKVLVNGFGLTSVFGQTIGIALCLQLSGLDHCCKPTSRIAFMGNKCRMIPTQNSCLCTPLTHSYINELLPRDQRRTLLKERYVFECECEGCKDDARNSDMLAFACELCAAPLQITATCQKCGTKMSAEQVDLCNMASNLADASVKAISRCAQPSDKLTLCEKSLAVTNGILYTFNTTSLSLLQGAYEASVALSRFDDAVSYGSRALEVLEHYSYSQDISVLHLKFNLAKIMLKNGDKQSCGMLMREVAPSIAEVYGKESAIYKELWITLNASTV